VGKSLVIVESPAKANTIGKFLGKGYKVEASLGNVRDLPRSQFGVDIDNDFTPKYITIRGKGKVLQNLRRAARKADRIYLATDPDREGEAISWHLAYALKLDGDAKCRIEFHEITKKAITEAIRQPRHINQNLVNAQQARRILDRLVGYRLSPLLWEKVKRGLSAGRVQSPALRLIVEREEEIEAFEPEEYWSITAHLRKGEAGTFGAKLIKWKNEDVAIGNEDEANSFVRALSKAVFKVSAIRKKERRRYPAPPFTTSTLQQEASRKLRFSSRRTMMLAQQLYEGLDIGKEGTVGLITYIRTDATRVASEAQTESRQFIKERYGGEFVPPRPPTYKSAKGAQAAHEAIRPTSVMREPDKVRAYLSRDQYRLYRLIWERFVASQMAPAVLDTVSVDVVAGEGVFRASGYRVKFNGFMSVYIEDRDDDNQEEDEGEEKMLPELEKGEQLFLEKLDPQQHFTKPPVRYTEAMLVRTLEERAIGRPSTYTTILEKIRDRAYVTMEDRRFKPTELGRLVVGLLKEHFPDIIDIEFTANLEEQLDEIEEGDMDWVDVLDRFYDSFRHQLEAARENMEKVEVEEPVTDEICEKCGRNMVIKHGRYGEFLACPGFPECRNTKPILKEIGVRCPDCEDGQIVERRSRRGRLFYGCSNYPECKFTLWARPIDEKCPQCGHVLVLNRRKNSKDRIKCSNKECGYEGLAGDENR